MDPHGHSGGIANRRGWRTRDGSGSSNRAATGAIPKRGCCNQQISAGGITADPLHGRVATATQLSTRSVAPQDSPPIAQG